MVRLQTIYISAYHYTIYGHLIGPFQVKVQMYNYFAFNTIYFDKFYLKFLQIRFKNAGITAFPSYFRTFVKYF